MPVPDYQSLMLPVLKALSGSAQMSVADVRERVALAEGLTDDDRRELLPSGSQPVFVNRISWGLTKLTMAGLVERVRRGVYRLTEDGQRLLGRPPKRITIKLLREYPAYAQASSSWGKGKSMSFASENDEDTNGPPDAHPETPEETIDRAYQELRLALQTEVLDRIREAEPEFLERTVVDLLGRMGYGGGDPARKRVTGGPGDGGIDGEIHEDALGLDKIYIQTKRYAAGNPVGASDIRGFAGALLQAGTTKGVFVTASRFTDAAQDYVAKSPQQRIILIDGEKLALLMVRHDLGVREKIRYEVKRIDEDYFAP